MLSYHCSLDLALTYSMRRPKLAMSLAKTAFEAALHIRRPDLAYKASELMAAIGQGAL